MRRIGSILAVAAALVSADGFAQQDGGAAVRVTHDAASNLTTVVLEDGGRVLLERSFDGLPGVIRCAGPTLVPLRWLGELRDAARASGGARALALLRRSLGPHADTPAADLPLDAGAPFTADGDCSRVRKFRYSNCSGECGTIDNPDGTTKEISCNCETTDDVCVPAAGAIRVPGLN